MSTFTARVFTPDAKDRGHDINDRYDKTPRGSTHQTRERSERSEQSDPPLEVTSLLSLNSPPYPSLNEAVLTGPVGEFVRLVEPHTEADPAALAVQFLALGGNALGRNAYYRVEADEHHTNEFVLVVAPTGDAGRKGVSYGHARRFFALVDEEWASTRQRGGLSSGEGLVWHVRDPVTDKAGNVKDEGVGDKRLCVVESEFASVLRVMSRQGNTLSALMRQAWDSGSIFTLTKHNAATATGTHISLVAHITREELLRELSDISLSNGFLNRMLVVCAKRQRCLPDGGTLAPEALAPLALKVTRAFDELRRGGCMTRSDGAKALWHAVYPALTRERAGMVGAVRGRAAAHVLRLSMIYAALEGRFVITETHLRAALALWEYCEASALYIFGDRTGDPLADHLLGELRQHAPLGLTRTEITNLYLRHRSKEHLDRALGVLLTHGLARMEKDASNPGRPVERWFAVTHGTPASKGATPS